MSHAFIKEMDELIRARYTLLYVVTWEEQRARQLIGIVAEKQKKTLYEWSITDGLRRVTGPPDAARGPDKRQRDVMTVLNEVLQSDSPALYILKDFHTYLEASEVVRQLRDLDYALRHTRKTIIVVSPTLKIPPELDKAFTIVDLPLPEYDELRELLQSKIGSPGVNRQFRVNLSGSDFDALVKAAQGLTLTEAENAFAKAIVRDKVLDADDIAAVVEEKRQVIRKSGLLEYYDVEEQLDVVGGMDLLKDWLSKRLRAFSQEARDYGLPAPRGVLLLGVQGCGKSLVAKTIAATWRLPLLRMDVSRIFQGYIGSSEANMRMALKVAESIAPVVLWVDEIEKALSGVEGSGATDAGTTARVVGLFLTWMQEKKSPVFVVATANDVKGLPPELLRKGRLDEIFFVDLPRGRERVEIFQIHLRKLGRDPAKFDMRELMPHSRGFSGAEIEQAIISALHDSFFDNREVETRDILHSLHQTVPFSRTMRESVDTLRAWSLDRARPVSSYQQRPARSETMESQ